MTTPKQGGARKGAGRKASDGATGTIRKQVTLDAETVQKAQNIGRGNLSEGVRMAVKSYELLPNPGDATKGAKNEGK